MTPRLPQITARNLVRFLKSHLSKIASPEVILRFGMSQKKFLLLFPFIVVAI